MKTVDDKYLRELHSKMEKEIPSKEWESRCHEIATLAADIDPRLRVRRGCWVGPFHQLSRFHKRLFTQHSWCVLNENRDFIVDPTQMFFTDPVAARRGQLEIQTYDPSERFWHFYDLCGIRVHFALNSRPKESGEIIVIHWDKDTQDEVRKILEDETSCCNQWGAWDLKWALMHPELSWGGRMTLARHLLKTEYKALVPIDIAMIAQE